MPRHVKYYAVPGERGFPQHIVRESVSAEGAVNRQMVATCNEAKYASVVIDRLNQGERCMEDHT